MINLEVRRKDFRLKRPDPLPEGTLEHVTHTLLLHSFPHVPVRNHLVNIIIQLVLNRFSHRVPRHEEILINLYSQLLHPCIELHVLLGILAQLTLQILEILLRRLRLLLDLEDALVQHLLAIQDLLHHQSDVVLHDFDAASVLVAHSLQHLHLLVH